MRRLLPEVSLPVRTLDPPALGLQGVPFMINECFVLIIVFVVCYCYFDSVFVILI